MARVSRHSGAYHGWHGDGRHVASVLAARPHSPDRHLAGRVRHTHTAANVTDFSEAVDDRVGSLLTAGSNITLNYNDAANTLTIASTASGGSSGAGFRYAAGWRA